MFCRRDGYIRPVFVLAGQDKGLAGPKLISAAPQTATPPDSRTCSVRRSGIDARRLPDILGCGVFSKQVGVCRASMPDLRQQFVFTIVSEYQTRFPPALE